MSFKVESSYTNGNTSTDRILQGFLNSGLQGGLAIVFLGGIILIDGNCK